MCGTPEFDSDKFREWLWRNREALIAAAEELDAIKRGPGAFPDETLDQTTERHAAVFLKAYDLLDEAGRRAMAHYKQRLYSETLLVWKDEMARLREQRDRLQAVATEAAFMLAETNHGGLTFARSESMLKALRAAGVDLPKQCEACPHGLDHGPHAGKDRT